MNIREMTAADIPPALEIDSKSFDKPWRDEDFCDELKKDYSRYYIAEEGGEPVGYIGIWCIYETAELIRIAVAPRSRGRGAGAALVEAACTYSREQGCERMLLEVRSSNAAARRLYEKCGFCEMSVRRKYYDGTEDAVIMEKNYG